MTEQATMRPASLPADSGDERVRLCTNCGFVKPDEGHVFGSPCPQCKRSSWMVTWRPPGVKIATQTQSERDAPEKTATDDTDNTDKRIQKPEIKDSSSVPSVPSVAVPRHCPRVSPGLPGSRVASVRPRVPASPRPRVSSKRRVRGSRRLAGLDNATLAELFSLAKQRDAIAAAMEALQ